MDHPFESAVEQHGATVLKVCRAVLGPGADSEDAWSETFLSALQAWPSLDNGANVEAWLVRIAHRKAIDVTRKRQRHPLTNETVPETESTLGIPGQAGTEIWLEVAKLPERQRLAVAYHYLGGLPHGDTAELIGGSPASIRRAAADGIAKLRTVMIAHRAPDAKTREAAPVAQNRGRTDARESGRTEL